jgi:hypothetical protein
MILGIFILLYSIPETKRGRQKTEDERMSAFRTSEIQK